MSWLRSVEDGVSPLVIIKGQTSSFVSRVRDEPPRWRYPGLWDLCRRGEERVMIRERQRDLDDQGVSKESTSVKVEYQLVSRKDKGWK